MKTKLFLILGVFLFFAMSFVSATETITIQVNNIYTGEPIEDANVEAQIIGRGYNLSTKTDSEGIATFDVEDNSLSSIWVSKGEYSEEWFGYVSYLTNNNYLEGTLTPLYLYKQESDSNIELTFHLIGNRPDVTYYPDERFNNLLKIKNIWDKDVVFSQETPIKVGYSYDNGPDIDWGKQEHTESVTIHPQGYLFLEAIGNDVRLCASGAYAQGIEIDLSSRICMTTPALDKNIIPDNLHGLFYGIIDISYNVDSTKNDIQLTTDNFNISNEDFWWAMIIAKLNGKFDEFGDDQRINVDVTITQVFNVSKITQPYGGVVSGNSISIDSLIMSEIYDIASMDGVISITPIINTNRVDLQEVLDTIDVEITLTNETTEINIIENFEGTSLDVSDIYGFEYNDLTTFELFESINFEIDVNKENDDWIINVNSLEVSDSDAESLINLILANLNIDERISDYELEPSLLNQLVNFQLDTTCDSGTLKKEGVNINFVMSCGLNDINSLEDFEMQTLSILSLINPTKLNELLFNYTNTEYDYDFEVTTDLDGLNFDLREGSYDVVFNYEDSQGNTGIEVVRVNINWGQVVIISGGGGGGGTPEAEVESYDLGDYSVQQILMGEGQIIEINVKGRNHEFEVISIGPNFASIEIRSDPIELTLEVGSIEFVDTSGNGKDDLRIELLSVSYKPYNIRGNTAEFKISEIEETEPISIGFGAGEGEQPEEETPTGFFSFLTGGVIGVLGTGGTIIVAVVFAAAIIFLVIFLSRINKRSKKKKRKKK